MSDKATLDIRRATWAGLSSYVIWGISPLFFQLLDFASALEIVLRLGNCPAPCGLGRAPVIGRSVVFRAIETHFSGASGQARCAHPDCLVHPDFDQLVGFCFLRQ